MTLKPNYKAGIRMRVADYEAIKKEIVDLIKHEEGVPLLSFFEILHSRFVDHFRGETSWYLYHMKLDLETRTIIKVERSREKKNVKTMIKMAPVDRKHKPPGRLSLKF